VTEAEQDNLVVNPTGGCLRRANFSPSFISGCRGTANPADSDNRLGKLAVIDAALRAWLHRDL